MSIIFKHDTCIAMTFKTYIFKAGMLIVFLAVITPSASTVTQMCQVYGNDSRYASAINVVTTLCAIVTMPVMVLLYEEFI